MSKQISDAYIVAATRAPIGKSGRGMFRNTRPDDLLVAVIQAALAQVPTPTLVVVGEGDSRGASAGELAALLPNGRLAVVPGDHVTAPSAPEFTDAVANFLDDLVGWLTRFFYWLKWSGTVVLGTVVVLRFGGRKAALGTLAAFA